MNLWEDFLKSDLSEKAAEDINKMLDEEFKKPECKRDYRKIQELTGILPQVFKEEIRLKSKSLPVKNYSPALVKIMSLKKEIGKATSVVADKLKEKTRTIFRIQKSFISLATASCLIFVTIFGTSIRTLATNEKNERPYAIYHSESNNFLSVMYPKDSLYPYEAPEIDLSETDDPYGIIAECAKYGMNSESPHYIPEELTLNEVSYSGLNGGLERLFFDFLYEEDGEFERIYLQYMLYENTDMIPYHATSCAKSEISDIILNDKHALRIDSEKYEWHTVMYHMGSLVIQIICFGMPEEEADKVIASIK